MKKLNTAEVNELLNNLPRRTWGSTMFAEEIEKLESGEGLLINLADWPRKTKPTHYFPTKFNKSGRKCVKVKVINEQEYLIQKL